MLTSIRSMLSRHAKAATVAAVVISGSLACDSSVLDVEDPDNITPPQQLTPGNLPTEFAGVVGDFREALDDVVNYGGLLGDEFVLGGTFPTRLVVDERRPTRSNSATTFDDVWTPMNRAVLEADTLRAQLQRAQGEPEFAGLPVQARLATTTLLAGYMRIYFAELWCQSIIGGDLPGAETSPRTSDERMQEAISVLQQAESIAESAGETDVANAARVGQARAHMWLGNLSEASSKAGEVDEGHAFQVEYSDNQIAERNEVYERNWGNVFNIRWTIGDGTPEQARGAERFGVASRAQFSGSGLTDAFDEWVDQGLIFPDTDPDNDLAAFGSPQRPVNAPTVYGSRAGDDPGDPINISTWWEAQMIQAEVMLRNGNVGDAETLVNDLLDDPEQSRNPILQIQEDLNQPPSGGDVADGELGAFQEVDFVSGELATNLAKLARARAAGMYLTGTRQGYFRRLHPKSGGPVDLFPARQGDAISLPLTDREIDNNPNVSSACPSGLP